MQAPDELLSDFIAEALESMDKLDQGVMQLEKSPDDQLLLANAFRAIHTIKGSSGFFGLKRVERLSHAAETLLGNLRDGRILFTKVRANALLDYLDGLRTIIHALQTSKSEPQGDDQALIDRLKNLASQSDAELVEDASSDETNDVPVIPVAEFQAEVSEPDVSKDVRLNDSLAPVKVAVELLDDMVNKVSELVLARNRLLPYAQRDDDRTLADIVETIDRLTMSMQEKVLKTRMQTIGQLWSRLPRLARDVAMACGKEVEVICLGQNTELDRSMLDAIKDPIIHVLRNCIDHGIESPQERLANSKPRQGLVRLDARHENGAVVVVIEDDGRGLDIATIGQKAMTRGLISAEALAELSEDQISEFIFLPGFSTRDEVTEISGRGVGMDVVRTNLAAVGGHIRLRSIWGHGTCCTLTVPLTLAIIPALLVQVDSEHYALPQSHVSELLRYRPGIDEEQLEDFYGTPVLRRPNSLLPIYGLREWVDLPSKLKNMDLGAALHIVVVEAGDHRFGLLVDQILNLEEIVIKPLPPAMQQGSLFSGATIQGDGKVALILDVGQLVRRSNSHAGLKLKFEPPRLLETLDGQSVRMLLVQIPEFGLSAIPMQFVWRLDKISGEAITQRAGHAVLAYQDHVIRLLDLEALLNKRSFPSTMVHDHKLDVVICRQGQTLVGLIVQHIEGMASLPEKLQQAEALQFGLLGMVLHNDSVVNVLNMPQILHGNTAPAMLFEAVES